MYCEHSESLPPDRVTSRRSADGPTKLRRAADLDGRLLESLLLNLDASLGVHARKHLFTWTQGLLQSLIRHKILICALRNGESSSFRADSFSTLVPDSAKFGQLFLQDAAVVPALVKAWKENRFLPAICNTGAVTALSTGQFAQKLVKIGATELLVHGSNDVGGEVRSLFVFGGEQGMFGPRETYFAQFVVPSLHTAWIRSQADETGESVCVAPVGADVLTKREKEILRWICLGKSNGEIGVILGISPLTVKNHVQKTLRKLNVVNRAQAVAKALDARIINP